ncbi:MAG: 4-hydroxyphenylacetate 3-hydroxylase family protein [Armatimonadota bacterium]|nr:4-hydroxyphenylacetate 3-hydroxylase family protein [Armatimonadota bacterium]MDR7387704.1 4-hydroxyphenylacetate 3-hydroxylase family protein [Armatimonadota bacterium]MDR7389136.1 4-hydroxyphenylacetate 3-hydroxylase family protein [Armatimonadota bacterium]MDR7391620.1 4-hydroxyphenylacetate 3-hydroxylase family protein [Armatimonadota bacterium]MDR7393438.1 4-hydroxyphenylacetate 3-hydroxylase family protein [Armatimonadota bacterium]
MLEVSARPMTGQEYLESLRDGREVYIHGERVRDVTTHPAFRNAARSIARLYDALHDPEYRDVLTGRDRFGLLTHKFFKPSYAPQELLEARDAIACWARLTYGFMGRTPDYKASFMATLGAAPEFYEPFTDNAARWYREYASRVLFLNHCLVNPPVDRTKKAHEVEDVFLRVVRETDGGIVVSGAKMLATASALTHATFVAQNSASAAMLEKGKAEDYALVFIAPMDTRGQKLISRPSYELRAESPFDHPLSSRFDENDAVLIYDNAFIPWEHVLVYRDVDKAQQFYAASGFLNRYNLQASTRLAVKLDFMCGLLAKALAANGTDGFRGVQAQLGEVIGWRNLVWAMTSAMALDPQPGPGGTVIPRLEYAATARLFATLAWPRVKEIFELVLGGSPLYTVSSYRDLLSPELRPLVDRYYRGTGMPAEERVKLFKLVWDAIGSEFGGRHELYERNYSGNHEQMRLDLLTFARNRGLLDAFVALVDRCLNDYDLNGWRADTWVWDRPAEAQG